MFHSTFLTQNHKMFIISLSLLFLFCTIGNTSDEIARHERMAQTILEKTGIQGGLVVHLGCGDGKLTAALHVNDRYLIHGLDTNPENVETGRKHIQSLGFYGEVSVDHLRSDTLPYTDNLVNLLIAENLGNISMKEVMRVLSPGGVAYIQENGKWKKSIKPWPEEIDEWTHYLHDASGNAVAKDKRVGPPKHLQWVSNPLYCRSHEIDSSISACVSANGRLFTILDEGLPGITDKRLPSQWALVARDAFNGVQLWKIPMPEWGWREWKREELEGKDWTGIRGQRLRFPLTLSRRLVADRNQNRLFVTLGYDKPVTTLDAATGNVIREYDSTQGTDEIIFTGNTLYLCIRELGSDAEKRRTGEAAPEKILAVDSETGDLLWQTQAEQILPLSLAASGERIIFHDYQDLVCLNRNSGKELWRAPHEVKKASVWSSPSTLIALQDVILFAGPKHLEAFSSESGKSLWTGPRAKGPGVANPPDLFYAGKLIWAGGDRKGRDPLTGEVQKTIEVHNLISPGHHYRCYRSKATENYLLWPKRGVEFISLESDDHMRHDWLRAACRYGFMPANGILYMPPHQCFCYTGVKLNGFNALVPELQPKEEKEKQRLVKGPAFQSVSRDQTANANDWPTFRRNAKRSGSTTFSISSKITNQWETAIGGEMTQPVVADGKLYVASIDAHRLYALNHENGNVLWDFTAGGRIDSPPTYYKGYILFGAADGYVYCLRALDGELVWCFQAAPEDRRIVAFDQLESAWPVHGSVLIKDDVAYFAAGRSSYLDQGIFIYGLEPISGKQLYETQLEGPYPDPVHDVGRPFDMEGTKSDVLVTDGTYLYMQQTMLDSELREIEAPRLTEMGDRKMGRHIFSTAGFLDDTWWNRTFWMYTERWPGFYIANQAPKTGQLLVFNKSTTYGVKCYTRRNRHSPMYFPGTDGYLLFADDNENKPNLYDGKESSKPVEWLPEVNPAIGHKLDMIAVDKDKGTGFTRTKPPKWAEWVPIRVRAMTLTDQTLFIAGPPDVLDEDDPLVAFEGRKGGKLRAVSAASGKTLAEYELDSPPVFDGMIAAADRLYLSTEDGNVLCYAKK